MSELSLTDATISDIQRLALQGMGPQAVPGGTVPYVLVPEGYKAQPMPELVFNEHTERPERIKQTVAVFDADSFVEYYKLFKDADSRAFADEVSCSVLAVLDYHQFDNDEPQSARWCSHRVHLKLRQSVEWQAWVGNNNKPLTQQVFAEFLEQHSMAISAPRPAAIIEMASDLHATTEVDFGSGLRQQDGQIKFKYTETTKSSVGGSSLQVPDRFTLSIPVFVGADRVNMEALLRFRVKDAKLSFFFTLVRPDEVIRSAFLAARAKIAEDLGVTIINGNIGW